MVTVQGEVHYCPMAARIALSRIDHVVITCKNIHKTIGFYAKLGMRHEQFGQGRHALSFGAQKLNLHQHPSDIQPRAHQPTPGAIDICLIAETPVEQIKEQLEEAGIEIEEGIVERTGATGPIRSIYVRDPDLNLVELSNYV